MVLYPVALRISIILAFAACISGCWSKESAWNGATNTGVASKQVFTPYYVPPGAKSYDSSSPLIHYTGTWHDAYSASYVSHSLRWTDDPHAKIQFTFTGTGIEWFGNTGPRHGKSNVYLDGQLIRSVNAWSHEPRKQQRIFWEFDLPDAKHTIKVVHDWKASDARAPARMDLDAFIVTKRNSARFHTPEPLENLRRSSEHWTLVQKGSTGVNAMQLVIVSPTKALVVDKVEHNPATISGHPAWAALYDINTHAIIPLSVESNSFCAGGTFLRNGTLINVGGNPVVGDHTGAADFGDLDGLQAIRIFEPCESNSAENCRIYENHLRIRLASPRWYNTVIRISDGSAMIIGGSKKGGWINNATVNNPTIEYFPTKAIHNSNGLPIHLAFLVDTLNSNLFPIAHQLSDGRIFIAANNGAMIYDWQTNTEHRLPPIPNGVRVTYPMAGTGLLLPLSLENGYASEILVCGGSTIDDTKPGYEISSQDVASAQCSRLLLTDDGLSKGWEVEQMPAARLMLDAVLLPTGQVLIVNGAGSGISGYGNVMHQVGSSNADNPVLTAVLYDPLAPLGARFSSDLLPTSRIPRLYHSVATLTPNGDIMIAGSNPNLDRSEVEYGTEYRVEWLRPPYMTGPRPTLSLSGSRVLGFGKKLTLKIVLPVSAGSLRGV